MDPYESDIDLLLQLPARREHISQNVKLFLIMTVREAGRTVVFSSVNQLQVFATDIHK